MKMKWVGLAGILDLASAAGILIGQEKEDRTLLSQQQMTAIINEVSGERAMLHVLELVPYQFVRPPSELNCTRQLGKPTVLAVCSC